MMGVSLPHAVSGSFDPRRWLSPNMSRRVISTVHSFVMHACAPRWCMKRSPKEKEFYRNVAIAIDMVRHQAYFSNHNGAMGN